MPIAQSSFDGGGYASAMDAQQHPAHAPGYQALVESEASYKAALQAGNMGSWQTDLRAGRRIWTQEGMALFGVDLPDGLGQVGGPHDEWIAAVHPEDRDFAIGLRRHALTRDSFPAEYRIMRPSGAIAWLSGRGRVLERDESGRPVRLVSIMADISDRKAAELALRESEARFRSLFENAAVGMAFANLDGAWVTVNQRLCALLHADEADLIGRSAEDFLDSTDRGREDEELRRLLAREIAHASFEVQYRRGDGTPVWIGRTASLVMDAQGVPQHVVSVYRDITERRLGQDHQRFLLAELSHRSKNLLAVIQAIAGQTLRSVETLEDFKARFTQRLQGIAATQDILVRQDWTGGDLRQLLSTQLEIFDLGSAQISVSGPDVTLSADAIQSLGLAVHELATNALKYGALSVPAGRVVVAWEIGPAGSLSISWAEEGGPPVVPPSRAGFGSTVLDKMAAASVDGSVSLAYGQTGVTWTLSMPGQHFSLRPAS